MRKALSCAGRYLKEIAQEQVEFRELLIQMTRRDLRLRYKQTVMGCGWAVFMPLLNTLIFSTIFTRIAPIKTDVPYPIFAFCGLVAWNLTASALRFSTGSLTSNSNLVTKVRFPREIFPFSAVIVSVVDSAIGFVLLAGFTVYYGIWPTSAIIMLPVILLVHVAFTSALALLLAMGNLFYRDVKYLAEVAITIWMFASSVVYPLQGLGGKAGMLAALNPITHIIDAYRAVLLMGTFPNPVTFGATTLLAVTVLLGSWMAFHASEHAFAENI